MKISLVLDAPGDIQPGIISIDPFSDGKDGRVQADINNFDQVADDAEVEELIATEILEYFPAREVDSIIRYWLKKLKHGGVLKLTGLDAGAISEGFIRGKLSPDEYNMYVYGHQDKNWRYRKSLFTGEQVRDVLSNLGLKIRRWQLNCYQYYLEGVRP